jgi:hypothetical protein
MNLSVSTFLFHRQENLEIEAARQRAGPILGVFLGASGTGPASALALMQGLHAFGLAQGSDCPQADSL